MKTYYKVIISLAVLVIIGTGLWLYGQHDAIKTSAIEKRKTDTASFIQNRAAALIKPKYFRDEHSILQQQTFENFFGVIQSPRLVRIKVWDNKFTIIWSNLTELIGKSFPDNHEVKEALSGKIEFEIQKPKSEHISERQFQQLSETYVPISNQNGEIIGVIEVYEPIYSLNEEIKAEFQKSAIPTIAIALAGYAVMAFVLRFLIKAV